MDITVVPRTVDHELPKPKGFDTSHYASMLLPAGHVDILGLQFGLLKHILGAFPGHVSEKTDAILAQAPPSDPSSIGYTDLLVVSAQFASCEPLEQSFVTQVVLHAEQVCKLQV